MRTLHCAVTTLAFLIPVYTISFVSQAQSSPVKRNYKLGILSVAYFIESANNSVNSLNSLLKKDNYRNKITTLNNPTNNELGFSLKSEILSALKPLLNKTRKTDNKKFKDVIENFLSNPEGSGIASVKKYMPALGIFSTVLSLVGNLVINERSITREDFNEFIEKIQQYFFQYERLNEINQKFSEQLQKLLERSEETKQDLKDFLLECICTRDKNQDKQSIDTFTVEALMLKYYDPQKLQTWLDTGQLGIEPGVYPPDAATTVKMLTSQIKKLQKEFEGIYYDNYREVMDLLTALRNNISNLDEKQLNKTSTELDMLYNESRQADFINLNMMKE